jgi:CheY-like chemotaxis protein
VSDEEISMAKTSDYAVLVVDDEQDIRAYLSVALQDAGFRVATAASGREALEAVKRAPPDFISLDLVMPGGSGIAFLHELRRNSAWSKIPVMIVTGHAQDDLGRADLAQALEGSLLSGPGTYLEKPITPASYVAAVCKSLHLDSPVAAASDRSLRAEAEQLMKNASPERIAEIVALLKGK